MPFSITVDVTQVIQLLTRLSSAMRSEIPINALNAGAEALVNEAKSTVPVRTGNLQSSIAQQGSASSTGTSVSAEAEYAAYVELGTSRMSAQPYMRPAIQPAIEALVNTALEGINSVI